MKHSHWLVAAVVLIGASFQAWAAPENPARLPTAADTPPKVELLDAGKEPRTPLRLTFQKGDTFERVMSMRMGVRMSINGEPMPEVPTPTISVAMRGEIESVDAEFHARYSAEMGEATFDTADMTPAMQAMLKAQLADMAGTRVSARVSPRGFQTEGKVQTKSTNPQMLAMLDSMKQSFSQMSVPFPEEAVGVDARWAVSSELKMNGLPLRQRYVYRVASLGERGAILTVTVEQSLATPDAKMENLPAGVEGVARSLASEMSGRCSIRFREMMPWTSSMTGTSKAEMEMTTAGQKMPMTATYDISMRLRPMEDDKANARPNEGADEKNAEGERK
ncbi:MAG: hypothetical protein K2Y21_06040 [Phycisphaerales bacterium]|nr:hypothetical protein [Phycisphaerales bacterium]